MKQVFFSYLLIAYANLAAQIPNAGFEEWKPNGLPVGWNTLTPFHIYQDTSHVAGLYSVVIDGHVPGLEGPGAAVIGAQMINVATTPAKLSFFFKCEVDSAGGSCNVEIDLANGSDYQAIKWDTNATVSVFKEVKIDLTDTWINPVTAISVYFDARPVFGSLHSFGGAKMNVDSVSLDLMVAVDEVMSGEIEVFPNPFSEIIFIKSQITESISHLYLFDALGRIVREVNSEANQIETSDIPFGVYRLAAVFSDGRIYSRWVAKRPKR